MTRTLTLPPAVGVADPTPVEGTLPDAQLWAALLGGQLEAFDALYDRHAEAVHRLLVRRVGAQEAPDLTAEVFARAWAHRQRIRLSETGGLLPWLLGTALNLARGHGQGAASAGRLAHRLAGQGLMPEEPDRRRDRPPRRCCGTAARSRRVGLALRGGPRGAAAVRT